MTHNQQCIRENGIFYTPDGVAHFLAAELCRGLNSQSPRILDPSCGGGALLEAAKSTCDSVLPPGVARTAVFLGRDLFRPSSWPEDPRVRFQQGDFFCLSCSSRFDAIIMNPPYLQYSSIDEGERESLYRRFAKHFNLSRMIDLWAYFLLKSFRHVKPAGRVAAVVPWSILEAEYARALRRVLAESFHSIRVLVLRNRHFDSTEKRVVLLWLKGYGQQASRVEVAFSGAVEERHEFRPVTTQEWKAQGLLACHGLGTRHVLEELGNAGFLPLGELADVEIGVVTGANSFFITPLAEAEAMGFSNASRIPIVTHVKELRGLRCVTDPEHVLLRFRRLTAKQRARIRWGASRGIDKLTHCSRRAAAGKPWYDVDPGPVPDAFFTYRVSRMPFLVMNTRGFQCTNALHKVRFRSGLSSNARKWVQLALLSDAGQLSLETGARHYRSGAIKVEPSALKDTLVYAPAEPVHAETYAAASAAIAEGDKERASQEATGAMRKVSGLKLTLWRELAKTLADLRSRRNGA